MVDFLPLAERVVGREGLRLFSIRAFDGRDHLAYSVAGPVLTSELSVRVGRARAMATATMWR